MIILIADDNKLVRLSIKSMLCDIFKEDCIIIEAKNGKALVEKCSEQRPDLAFVDIDMPYLDGLTGISQCKNFAPDTQFVILTGHSDFAYAQKSISLGVVDYALKPLEMDYLKSLIDKLQKKRSRSLTAQNSDFQAYVSNLFQLLDEGIPADDCKVEFSGFYLGFLFLIKTHPHCDSFANVYHRLYQMLSHYGTQLLEKKIHFAVSSSNISAIRFIIHSEHNISINSVKQELIKIIKSISVESVGISAVYVCSSDLNDLHNELFADESHCYAPIVLPDQVIEKNHKQNVDECTGEFLKDLLHFINTFPQQNPMQMRKFRDAMKQKFGQCDLTVDYSVLSANLSKLTGSHFSICSFQTFLKALNHLETFCQDDSTKNTDKIEQIIDYIYQNYMNDIGINQLAEKFELTPNYLSTLFHEKTDKKFMDFLTQVRIDQAKHLLQKNPSALIKDIALMVGYVSARHFSTVFKKTTGVLPAEFRDNDHCYS